jgi:hypothetical protein
MVPEQTIDPPEHVGIVVHNDDGLSIQLKAFVPDAIRRRRALVETDSELAGYSLASNIQYCPKGQGNVRRRTKRAR